MLARRRAGQKHEPVSLQIRRRRPQARKRGFQRRKLSEERLKWFTRKMSRHGSADAFR